MAKRTYKPKVLPPGKVLRQIFKITNKRLGSRKRKDETTDQLISRLIDQYEKRPKSMR